MGCFIALAVLILFLTAFPWGSAPAMTLLIFIILIVIFSSGGRNVNR